MAALQPQDADVVQLTTRKVERAPAAHEKPTRAPPVDNARAHRKTPRSQCLVPLTQLRPRTSPPLPARRIPRRCRSAGASRGIGRDIAAHLSSLGASVVLGYSSSAAEADALAAELPRAVAVRADVSEEAGVRSLCAAAESAFGCAAPHIMVANARVLDDKYPSLADTATADFDRVLAVNARGAFLCLREAANRLPRGGGGRIVAVTSSVVGSHPTGYSAYTASKAAVEAMVRTMGKELKGTRVTANCVAPGATATDMFFAGKSDETVRRIAETNPMERLGEAGDIAPVVGFLCTEAAEWVNGQVIRVNGGYV